MTFHRWECSCGAVGRWGRDLDRYARFRGRKHLAERGDGHAIRIARKVTIDEHVRLDVL